MRPSLVALSKYTRVISYSLAGDIGSGARMDSARGFSVFTTQLEDVLARTGLTRVALCGVSFGGVVAAHYAAAHPERVSYLIIASSPGPGWKPTVSQAGYVGSPWLSLPALALTGAGRVGLEIAAALPGWSGRMAFAARYLAAGVRYPALPHLMAERVRLIQTVDLAADCARIEAPTLVITGEQALDRVVPTTSTREYVKQIRGARYVMMDRTGHLGSLTQPERFARIVGELVNASSS